MASETAKEPWKEKFLRLWMQMRLAHEGMMLSKIKEQNKIVIDNAKKLAGQPVSGDDMNDVSIGNEVHNHYESDVSSTEAQTTSMSPLAKVLAATALVAGGAGVGYLMADKMVDTDTDTQYQFEGGLGHPP